MRAATKGVMVAMVLCMAGPVAAQEIQDTVDQVQDGMKSPGVALLLEAHPFIPLLGHWYAGDVKRGILPTVVNLGGLPLALMCLDIIGDSGCSDTQDMISAAGAIAFFAGWAWRMSSAHGTASDRNQAIRARDGSLEISYGIMPVGDRIEFGATLRLKR